MHGSENPPFQEIMTGHRELNNVRKGTYEDEKQGRGRLCLLIFSFLLIFFPCIIETNQNWTFLSIVMNEHFLYLSSDVKKQVCINAYNNKYNIQQMCTIQAATHFWVRRAFFTVPVPQKEKLVDSFHKYVHMLIHQGKQNNT